MDDMFEDEDGATEVIMAIEMLCAQLGWTMRLVQAEDEEGGISGMVLGSEDFINELVTSSGELAEEDTDLH